MEDRPFLTIDTAPPGSTDEQQQRGLEAAGRVFDEAGVDPVRGCSVVPLDPWEERIHDNVWEAAERAATVACWAPREGEPEPTKLTIMIE